MKKFFLIFSILITLLIGINVKAIEKKAIINIDTPNTFNYYGDELIISGWTLSNVPGAKVKILIDDKEVKSTYRWYRSDVYGITGYGSSNDNPMPGYTGIVDLNDINDGKHVITINVQDSTTIINEKSLTLNIQKNRNDASIDAPDVSVSGTKLHIGGWALSSTKNSQLNIYVDNRKINDNNISRFTRTDVISSIKGYNTNLLFNQKCGYDTYYDVNTLNDGNHEIRLDIVSNGTVLHSIKKLIKLKKYNSIINIDSPSDNSKVTGNVTMGGWIMSDCPDYKVISKIDGTVIDAKINRFARADVIKSISGYGGENINKNPGFDFKYDVENLSLSQHKLSISIVNNKTNEEIATKDRVFNIKRPTTHLGIDSFKENQTIAGDKLSISGWVMSEVSNAYLEIYFNGQLIDSPISRFKRTDVIKAIKDCGNATDNPGYITTYDVSGFKDGTYNVKFVVKNPKTNQALYEESRNIKLKKYQGTSSIDSPQKNIEGTSVMIGGWVLSDNPNSEIKLFVDDIEIKNVSRWNRTDIFSVISGYGGKSNNKNAGYNVIADLSNITDGEHNVILQILNPKTGEIIHQNSKKISIKKYKTKATFDSIQENNTYIGTNIQVGGWVMSTDKNIEIETTIDNIPAKQVERILRQDVLSSISGYGDLSQNPKPGFNSYIDVSSLSDGEHVAKLIVRDKTTNEQIYTLSRKFKLKKYDGKIGIDAPISSVYNNKTSVNILVGGWALCQQEESTISIYIDNVWQNVTINRYARSDLTSVSNYGSPEKNQNAGFNTIMNIGHLVSGTHTITIKLYNKEGELVTTASKVIQVYDNIYPGIDVSYHNGTINWQSVVNDGKTFAMIRLGYRGYGVNGSLNIDKKFKENVTNASNVGLRTGLYFFSQATSYQEGVEEAQYVLQTIKDSGLQNKINYPIAFDTENSDGYPEGRADKITKQSRTEATLGFLRTIASNGYLPTIYASKSWFNDRLDMLQLQGYNVWLAHYTGSPTIMSDYNGPYQMWQYTSKGSVSGVSGYVDEDYSFTSYK